MSWLKDKIEIIEKTEKFLDKRLKNLKRNIKELSDSIKRSNLRVMGTEEDKQVKPKV
jgi:prefoldin subunit 5